MLHVSELSLRQAKHKGIITLNYLNHLSSYILTGLLVANCAPTKNYYNWVELGKHLVLGPFIKNWSQDPKNTLDCIVILSATIV